MLSGNMLVYKDYISKLSFQLSMTNYDQWDLVEIIKWNFWKCSLKGEQIVGHSFLSFIFSSFLLPGMWIWGQELQQPWGNSEAEAIYVPRIAKQKKISCFSLCWFWSCHISLGMIPLHFKVLIYLRYYHLWAFP